MLLRAGHDGFESLRIISDQHVFAASRHGNTSHPRNCNEFLQGLGVLGHILFLKLNTLLGKKLFRLFAPGSRGACEDFYVHNSLLPANRLNRFSGSPHRQGRPRRSKACHSMPHRTGPCNRSDDGLRSAARSWPQGLPVGSTGAFDERGLCSRYKKRASAAPFVVIQIFLIIKLSLLST